MRNTLFVGKVYLRFDEIASTNDYAKEMLSKNKPAEGTVVRADSQSAGRGQFGSTWASHKGENLLMSVILYPTFLEINAQFLLSIAVSIAVRDCVAAFLPQHDTKIKWPNDIYINHQKVAGILIQNALIGNQIQSAIVGIGLNVNQVIFAENLPNAGSLATIANEIYNIDIIEANLFQQIEYRYLQLKKTSEQSNLWAIYHQHLFKRYEAAEFIYPDGTSIWGIVQGVNPEGKLLIESGGQSLIFEVKDVKMKVN
jgi:BirA family transcriptional regulator, biotin operon repressor / biotin---[acetyl-CoA-carboxylase] ligase